MIAVLDKMTSATTNAFSDDMTRHGIIMVVFSLIAAFVNYLFQVSMGIMLTPVQYGTFSSLLSMLVILSVFSQTVHTFITKFTSVFQAQGKLSKVNYLWQTYLKRTFLIGAMGYIVLFLLTPLIAEFLNIENLWYPRILFPSFILALILPVNYGILRGLQRFVSLGTSNVLMAILKLAIGVLAVSLGFGLFGALLTPLLGMIVVFAVTTFFLKDIAILKKEKAELEGLHSYAGLTLLVVVAFTILTNIDIVMAKHYLSPDTAGAYSALSTLGKIALIAPAGIAIAMFPKTSTLHETGSDHYPVLLKALLLTLLLGGSVVAVYWLFPEFIFDFIFSGKYSVAVDYLFDYGFAMLLFAVAFLLMNYCLSLNQTKVAYSFLMAMLLQVVLIALFHSDIGQIVNVMIISGTLAIVLMLPFFFRDRGAIQDQEDYDRDL